MAIPIEVPVAAIGAIPALLAPLISSFLQRRGFAQKAREVEVIEKRVQIIERLLTLDQHLSAERRKLLQGELADIAQDVVAERERERKAGKTEVERLPRRHQWLLWYEQPTMRASVYRGLFWFFAAFGILGGVAAATAGMQAGDMDWPFGLLGGLVYVAIGLAFRAAALRQQRRAQASAAKAATGDAPRRQGEAAVPGA